MVVTVVDDYGHHPTEILATLRAARDCGYKRVHVIFQPHRYTRTRDLMCEFAGAFGDASTVEVLDIYAASEQPIEGVTASALANEIAGDPARPERAEYAASVEAAIAAVVEVAKTGDVVITQGAGSVEWDCAVAAGGFEAGSALIRTAKRQRWRHSVGWRDELRLAL